MVEHAWHAVQNLCNGQYGFTHYVAAWHMLLLIVADGALRDKTVKTHVKVRLSTAVLCQ
jgi:hypothetical protein